MNVKQVALLLSVILFFSCKKSSDSSGAEIPDFTIAFGSCSKIDLPQPLWSSISQNSPDAWVWLGDIVYADTDIPSEIERQYSFQRDSVADYKKLAETASIMGIWDDHDYGLNDGGKNYSVKKESRDLLFDFLEIQDGAPERSREGAYNSRTFGEGEKIKVILLDCRYFRDDLVRDSLSSQRYFKNETGDVLGEEQWAWLEKELSAGDAQFHIIGTGIQLISEEHNYEKWSNFPKARKRMLDLLEKIQPAHPVLISGDRHVAEISKIDLSGLSHPLFEITSSGLTHSFEEISEVGEINRHRVGNKISGEKNFGLIKIYGKDKSPRMKVEIRGEGNKLIFEEDLY